MVSPKPNYCKLNSDGAFKGNPGPAGSEGLIRGQLRRWVVGYRRRLGVAFNLLAKLWGFRDGLMLVANRNISCLKIIMDAEAVVDLIQSADLSSHAHANIVSDYSSILGSLQQVQLKHNYRESNRATDFLARKAKEQEIPFVILDHMPQELCNTTGEDMRRNIYPWACILLN
ncbi:hypothetical protein ACH5RR_008705 [Cinchona calisaya]|uniref:RNase H type-1 domain-containing protein n=1 Tax=Cinchona calisaya TaxID=153742 RepID=A0ABD3AHM3_9GENT